MYVKQEIREKDIEKKKIKILPKKEREEGIELLRIITMFMVLLLHYCGKGGFLNSSIFNETKVEIAWLIEAFSIVAVNCYILISGYFLINSKANTKKVIKLVLTVFVYSLVILLIFKFIFNIDISLKETLRYLFPTTLMTYWFITCYIALYILAPYINVVLKNINKESYKKLLLILLLISWSSNILGRKGFGVLDGTEGYGIIWFITLYTIGGYIRLHLKDEINKYVYLAEYFIISILVYVTRIIGFTDTFYAYNSITITLSSVCLFMFFKNVKLNNDFLKSAILKLSPLTLAVYIIHEHPLIRNILYNKILHTELIISAIDFIFGIFISCIGIYIVCCIIEWIRRKLVSLIELILLKIWKESNIYNILFNKIQKKDAQSDKV